MTTGVTGNSPPRLKTAKNHPSLYTCYCVRDKVQCEIWSKIISVGDKRVKIIALLGDQWNVNSLEYHYQFILLPGYRNHSHFSII